MPQQTHRYSNHEITVIWKPSLCIHSGRCLDLPTVFRPGQHPWIDMNGGTTDQIIRAVLRCPTGALTYIRNDIFTSEPSSQFSAAQAPPFPIDSPDTTKVPKGVFPPQSTMNGSEIRVRQDGPILISGNFQIFDTSGHEIKTLKMVSICHCGHTASRPFCDGSHFHLEHEEK